MSQLKLENMFQNLPSIYFRAKLHHSLLFKHCLGWSYQAQPSLPETDHWYHGLKRLTIDQINNEDIWTWSGSSWRLCWLHVPPSDLRRLKGFIKLIIKRLDHFSENRGACLHIVACSCQFAHLRPCSCHLRCCRLLQVISPHICNICSVQLLWLSLMQNVPFSPLSLCHILTPKTGFSRPSQIKKYPVHVRPRATIKHARRAKIFFGTLSFLSDPGIPGPIYGSKSLKLCNRPCWDLTDVTLADAWWGYQLDTNW